MEFKELKNKSESEVRLLVAELKSKAHDLSVKIKLNQLKNTNELKAVKKDIARALTFLHQTVTSKK